MNEAIELHDSKLAAVTLADNGVNYLLQPAYLHRSVGRPGFDTGSGWAQDVSVTISDVANAEGIQNQLPATISTGFLRVGSQLYDNIIPAAASFAAAIEWHLILSNGEVISILGGHIKILPTGPANYVEEFTGTHDRGVHAH